MDGYKIIDFKGIDPSDSGTIEGIFNAIDESKKPIVITNVTVGGIEEFKPCYVPFFKLATGPNTSAYITAISMGDSPVTIVVNDDDTITDAL